MLHVLKKYELCHVIAQICHLNGPFVQMHIIGPFADKHYIFVQTDHFRSCANKPFVQMCMCICDFVQTDQQFFSKSQSLGYRAMFGLNCPKIASPTSHVDEAAVERRTC